MWHHEAIGHNYIWLKFQKNMHLLGCSYTYLQLYMSLGFFKNQSSTFVYKSTTWDARTEYFGENL